MIFPKVSIITASFNSEKTISDTINSVLNQTYKNIEYIIVDGNSTDNTVSIIKQFEKLFNGRLKWISEKDRGVYDAWNKGLILSTGDWISFVGSDDLLLKDAIENYVNAIRLNPKTNFASSKIVEVKQDLTSIRVIGKPWSTKMRTYCCIAHVGCLHHRSLFDQKGVFNAVYRFSADYDLLLRCMGIIRPTYLNLVTAQMRQGGISNKYVLPVAKEVLKIKIKNKSRTIFRCIIEYYVMILKYYFRKTLNFFITR